MKDHVIGVDIGTTGTKTGIYDGDGRLKGEAFEDPSCAIRAPVRSSRTPRKSSVGSADGQGCDGAGGSGARQDRRDCA